MSTRSTVVAQAVADGFTGLVPDVRDALIVELLKLISGTAMTKSQLIAAAQADGFTGVEPTMRDALILELLSISAGMGGGGGIGGVGGFGGGAAGGGLNFCFTGAVPNQILKLKNLETGLANQIDSTGVDGVQSVVLQDGSAC